ncbi:MAG: heme ABC transporter ATP-binding protein [Haloarcula sp.]
MTRTSPPLDPPARCGGKPVLSVADLSVSLGGTEILSDIDLTVEAGELVGLVGPNGAGKTTLLRAIRGTLAPDSGQVTIADEVVHDLPSKAASRLVATVPQDTSVNFEFTVREAVEMGRTPHLSRFGGMEEADDQAVEQAMEQTDVTEFADRPVTAVSGGERSRVLLARALAQSTPLLLLDEPTASLDLNHQLRTFDTVAELVDTGRAAVAVIHDLNLAARYCDRLVVVAGGGVLADGPPEAVLTENTLRSAFDADAVVTQNPVTDRAHVTALSAAKQRPNAAPDGGSDDGVPIAEFDRVHVVAGGGCAGPLLSALSRADVETTVGPVATGDTDAEVAEALGMETLQLGPLERVGGDLADRTGTLAGAADAVVVADVELTEGLVPVLQAVDDVDVPVVCVETRALETRIVSDRAGDLYSSLRADGATITESAFVDSLQVPGSRSQ